MSACAYPQVGSPWSPWADQSRFVTPCSPSYSSTPNYNTRAQILPPTPGVTDPGVATYTTQSETTLKNHNHHRNTKTLNPGLLRRNWQPQNPKPTRSNEKKFKPNKTRKSSQHHSYRATSNCKTSLLHDSTCPHTT